MKSTLFPENLNTSCVDESKEKVLSPINVCPSDLNEEIDASLTDQIEVLTHRESEKPKKKRRPRSKMNSEIS